METGAGILRYRLWPGEPVDEFSLHMLQQNTPDEVLLLGRETTEEGDWLLLPVAGVVSLASALRSERNIVMKVPDRNKLLASVERVRCSLENYMIPTEELVLRPEWTWVRPETGDPVFLVLPTPSAADLTLSAEDYEMLVGSLYEECPVLQRERSELHGARVGRERYIAAKRGYAKPAEKEDTKESAKRSAKGAVKRKTLRERVREFWNELD